MSTQDILNYRQVNDQIITGGQPTEEQLKSVAADGFETVINLATIDPRYSLPDEEGLARSVWLFIISQWIWKIQRRVILANSRI